MTLLGATQCWMALDDIFCTHPHSYMFVSVDLDFSYKMPSKVNTCLFMRLCMCHTLLCMYIKFCVIAELCIIIRHPLPSQKQFLIGCGVLVVVERSIVY